MRERWVEKEEMLKEFYAEPDPAKRRFKSEKTIKLDARELDMWVCLVFWICFIIASFYAVITFPFARFYFFMMILFYFVSGFAFGGVDKLEMLLYDALWKPYEKWAKHRQSKAEAERFYDKYLNK